MRIDRRGNPGYRKIPISGEMEGDVDLNRNRKSEPGRLESEAGRGENRVSCSPSSPSDAFSDLDRTDGGLVKNFISMLAAVGRALKEIRQGNSKSFD